MHRDWSLELMMRLADGRDSDPAGFIGLLDERLDDLSMSLLEFKRRGVLSGRSLSRALSLISELRSRLEDATDGTDVRRAFEEIDELRELIENARAIHEDRQSLD